MMKRPSTIRLGRNGALEIPAKLRRRYRLREGTEVVTEEREEGILIRPAKNPAIEIYTPERQAEFLLSNAVDAADYRRAVKLVRKMGLEPEEIPHRKPRGA